MTISFQELGPSHHPVIVLPGVEFSDLCALVTFMYSGEVNIYESQLASLLSMADVLHIRGLADFSNVRKISINTRLIYCTFMAISYHFFLMLITDHQHIVKAVEK